MADAIAELWEANRPEALRRVELLEDAAAALAAGELDPAERELARSAAHKLRGALGMYGYRRAGELAGELEDVLAAPGDAPPDQVPRVASLVLSLRAALEGDPDRDPGGYDGDGGGDRLLLVSDDRGFAERFREAATTRELTIRWARLDEAAGTVEATAPDVVLADLESMGSREAALDLLSSLPGGDGAPGGAVLALAPSDRLLDRVEAARRGAAGVIERDMEAEAILDAVDRHLARSESAPATVLAVDDDPAVLAALEAMLAPHGFRVVGVDRAEHFWERLESVAPDIALVDIDMPRVEGIELCRAVRADARWASLPLLIITAYREPELVRRAFAAGADDYLTKPLDEEDLATRMRNRLERLRAYREASGRDGLTGALSRTAALAALEELAKQIDGGPLSLALVDIVGLRALNERQGLRAGDAAVRAVGRRLSTTCAGGVVGRWDGDQFMVGMACDGERARARIHATLAAEGLPEVRVGMAESREGAPVDVEGMLRVAEAELTAPASAPRPGEPTVDLVVVEDDSSVVDVLELALAGAGITSCRFEDGSVAVEALVGNPPAVRPRVVLLDWDLPGLDGLSVLRRLAEAGVLASTRVIMLTARGSESETLKALELGATDYVSKPFSVPVLVERVRRALEE